MAKLPFNLFFATATNYPAGADVWSGNPTRYVPDGGSNAYGWTPGTPPPAQYVNYLLGNLTESHNLQLRALCARFYQGAPDAFTPGLGVVWDSVRQRWITIRRLTGTTAAAGVRGADGRQIVNGPTATLTFGGSMSNGVYVPGATPLAIFCVSAAVDIAVVDCQTLVVTRETLPGVASGGSIVADPNGNVYVAGAGVIYKRAAGGTTWVALPTPPGFGAGDTNIAMWADPTSPGWIYAFNRDATTPKYALTANFGVSWGGGAATGISGFLPGGFSHVGFTDITRLNGLFYMWQTGESAGGTAVWVCTSPDLATWTCSADAGGNGALGVGFKQVCQLNNVWYAVGYRRDSASTAGIHSEIFTKPVSGQGFGWQSSGVMVSPNNNTARMFPGDVNVAINEGSGTTSTLFSEPQDATKNNW